MTLGQRLRTARERLGKRQADIAVELGKRQPTVSAWENDEGVPSLRDAKRVAWAYGLQPAELLDCEMPEVAA